MTSEGGLRRRCDGVLPIAFVLLVAVVLRLGSQVAYHPLLMQFTDAWAYLNLSRPFDVPTALVLAPERPFGYPMVLAATWKAVGFHPGIVPLVQHLIGLATGLITYLLLRRWRFAPWLAAAAAAIVLWDLRIVALEQTLMPEVLFTGLTVAALALTVVGRHRPWLLFAAGLMLGATPTLRVVILATLPIWALYVLRRNWGHPTAIALALLGLAIPLGLYASANAGQTGRLGFSNASGYFLYGRVAHLADCDRMQPPADLRFLCQRVRPPHGDPVFYIWRQESPVRQRFPGWGATAQQQRAQNELVGRFARLTIASDPVGYAELVARDLVRLFSLQTIPGQETGVDRASEFLPVPRDVVDPVRGPLLSDYRNARRAPGPLLAHLFSILQTPRPLMGLLSLAVLLAIALRVARRIRPGAQVAETLLFGGIGVGMVVLAMATSVLSVRYLVPSAPLIVLGGALAVRQLAGAVRLGLARRGRHPKPPTLGRLPAAYADDSAARREPRAGADPHRRPARLRPHPRLQRGGDARACGATRRPAGRREGDPDRRRRQQGRLDRDRGASR